MPRHDVLQPRTAPPRTRASTIRRFQISLRLQTCVPVAIVLLLAGLHLGCAAQQSIGSDDTPPDFTIDLTVLVGSPRDAASNHTSDQPQPHHLRQSRYVLFPDGRLHFGADPKRGSDWLPPAVRVLDAATMHELWSRIQSESFAVPEAAEPVNFESMAASPGQVIYLLAVTAMDERWAIIRATPAHAPDPAMAAFIDHLAELAWAEQYTAESRPAPQRYYFGPDPYRRYR